MAQSKQAACQILEPKIVALISRYEELRERRSKLPQGTFDEDVQADGGSLHRVLNALGRELGHPPYTKEIITACLGEPDALRDRKQMGYFLDIYHNQLRKAGRKVEEKEGREYLIYFWRGMHDFLFFIVEDGRVMDHGWWFAYE